MYILIQNDLSSSTNSSDLSDLESLSQVIHLFQNDLSSSTNSSDLSDWESRSQVIHLFQNDLSSSTNSSDLSDWESLSLDIEQWNVLIKQLEDVLSVQCLLKMKPTLERPLPSIAGDPIHISVTKVLDGGKGICLSYICIFFSLG